MYISLIHHIVHQSTSEVIVSIPALTYIWTSVQIYTQQNISSGQNAVNKTSEMRSYGGGVVRCVRRSESYDSDTGSISQVSFLYTYYAELHWGRKKWHFLKFFIPSWPRRRADQRSPITNLWMRSWEIRINLRPCLACSFWRWIKITSSWSCRSPRLLVY